MFEFWGPLGPPGGPPNAFLISNPTGLLKARGPGPGAKGKDDLLDERKTPSSIPVVATSGDAVEALEAASCNASAATVAPPQEGQVLGTTPASCKTPFVFHKEAKEFVPGAQQSAGAAIVHHRATSGGAPTLQGWLHPTVQGWLQNFFVFNGNQIVARSNPGQCGITSQAVNVLMKMMIEHPDMNHYPVRIPRPGGVPGFCTLQRVTERRKTGGLSTTGLQDENSFNHQGGNVASCSSCWTLERTGMVRDVAPRCFHYPYLLSISVC